MQISNHNISAVVANNRLKKQEDIVAQSMERLSSGLSINHSKDQPAHMALSNKLNMHINGMEQAKRNADNTSSMIRTADSVMQNITNMIQRMRELSVQAASDSNTEADKAELQKEVEELKDEINRMSRDTEFNRKGLFDGTLSRRVYSSKGNADSNGVHQPQLSRMNVSAEVYAGTYEMKVTPADPNANPPASAKVELENGFSPTASVSVDENHVTIWDEGGFEMSFMISDSLDPNTDVSLEVTDMGGFQSQFGENENGADNIWIPAVNTETLYIDDLDISTSGGAGTGIFRLDEALRSISKIRSELGAYENRMDTVSESLAAKRENLTSSVSKLTDTDMAAEMTEYTSANILVQASSSVLSQCNDQPEMVLQLLQ